MLDLQSWQFATPHGFTLRGWHSPPSGKPLLHFLHGNSFCGLTYLPMLQGLAPHFDLWLSDIQGHGDSDVGGKFVGCHESARLAGEAFVHHLPLFNQVPSYAAGHSIGGVMTGLLMAAQPHMFQRAVLLDPVLFPPLMVGFGMAAQALRLGRFTPLARASSKRRHHWPSREAAMEALSGRGTYKDWTAPALQAFATHALRQASNGQGVTLKCPPSREAELFASMPQHLWSHLRQVQTPTRVLYGTRSFPFIAPSAHRWAASNPHVTLQQVDGNHCFMQCAPDMAAQHVQSFLLAP